MPQPQSRASDAGRIRRILRATRDDPEGFARAVLNQPLFPHQARLARGLLDHKRVIVSSANGMGKSNAAAKVIAWWTLTRPGAQVIVTAPSQLLVGSVMFKELRRLHAGAAIPLGGKITESVTASPQRWDLDPRSPGWGVMGFATTPGSVARASGHHQKDLLVILDEASDVSQEVWEAVSSLHYNKLLALSNPLHATGRLREMFELGQSDPATLAITWSAFDSPYADQDTNPYGMADRSFIESAKAEWGEDSAWYKIHVLGMFPDEDHSTLIAPAWYDAATRADRKPPGRVGDVSIGLDPSLGVGADRTAICVRDEAQILEIILDNRLDMPGAAARVAQLSRQYGVRPERIYYDSNGIGRDMGGLLAAQGLRGCVAYFGGASGGKAHVNLRSAVGRQLRHRLNPDRVPPFYLPPGPWGSELREEVLALRMTQGSDQKFALEPRDAMSKRLGRSPDAVDALMMTFAMSNDR